MERSWWRVDGTHLLLDTDAGKGKGPWEEPRLTCVAGSPQTYVSSQEGPKVA